MKIEMTKIVQHFLCQKYIHYFLYQNLLVTETSPFRSVDVKQWKNQANRLALCHLVVMKTAVFLLSEVASSVKTLAMLRISCDNMPNDWQESGLCI